MLFKSQILEDICEVGEDRLETRSSEVDFRGDCDFRDSFDFLEFRNYLGCPEFHVCHVFLDGIFDEILHRFG